jgi:hypothetical protein
MSNYSNFVIRFIRDDEPKNDDKIVITPIKRFDTLVFDIEFKVADSNIGSKKLKNTVHKNVLDENELRNYLELLINFMDIDDSPYRDYQFDLPNIPAIIVKYSELTNILEYINKYLDILVKKWPTKRPVEKDDDDEDDSESSESSDSSEECCYNKKSTHKKFDSDGDTIYSVE